MAQRFEERFTSGCLSAQKHERQILNAGLGSLTYRGREGLSEH